MHRMGTSSDDELKFVSYQPSSLFNMDIALLHLMRTRATEHPPLSIIVLNSSLDYSSCHLNMRSFATKGTVPVQLLAVVSLTDDTRSRVAG